jgi:hypothetical protein
MAATKSTKTVVAVPLPAWVLECVDKLAVVEHTTRNEMIETLLVLTVGNGTSTDELQRFDEEGMSLADLKPEPVEYEVINKTKAGGA